MVLQFGTEHQGRGGGLHRTLVSHALQQDFPCFSLCLRFEDESHEDEMSLQHKQ